MGLPLIRFDYLHDAPPDAIDALRSARLPRRFHDVAAAMIAVLVLCAVASAIERSRVGAAQRTLAAAQDRFERSRAGLERLRVQSRELDALLAEDRALREVRLSGPSIAHRLATIGNLVPASVTLDAMQATPDGYTMKGHAATLATFGALLAQLDGSAAPAHPATLRVTKDAGPLGALSFDIEAEPTP